jgi:hypothetical protein
MFSNTSDPGRVQSGRGRMWLHGHALGMVLWCSFLAACVATMLFFAAIDPQAIESGEAPHWWSGRLRVYALGFFYFWFVAAIAAALTRFMDCTARTGEQ